MTSPASLRFETDAQAWDAHGRPAEISRSQWYAMQLICWSVSRGGKAVGVSERLEAYETALRAWLGRDNPDWYEDMWDDRVYCKECGQSWRLENVSICSNCNATFPSCHRRPSETLPNGNSGCPVCNAGEIVG